MMPGVCALTQEIRNVLFPRGCAGCGAPDAVLCVQCRALFARVERRPISARLACDASIWACASYAGAARRAILRWKDHGDREAGRFLAGACASSAQRVAAAERWQSALAGSGKLAVVPAPSSRASVRRRGRLQTLELADALARALRRRGITAEPVLGLEMSRTRKAVQESARRSRQQRGHGIHAVSGRLQGYAAAVIVDDICTTGSTLLSCARALYAAGIPVLSLFAIAMVPDAP